MKKTEVQTIQDLSAFVGKEVEIHTPKQEVRGILDSIDVKKNTFSIHEDFEGALPAMAFQKFHFDSEFDLYEVINTDDENKTS